ncbi:MAG: hypothetical protein ACRD2C_07635 [Acidimicrobiales bacterium]
MAVVCIGSVRGAPGASTLAVLAAACWPRPIALIEADPAGGALAVRYRLGRTPGLAGLAALVRHGVNQEALWQHAQMLPGELPVVVAPESGEVTAGILRDCAPALAAWCGALDDVDIIIDCGRIAYRDVTWPLCSSADETIVVARPRAEELYPAAHRLRAMSEDVPSAGLVLIGDRPHSPAEITSQLGVQVRGVVADDSWAAGVLTVGGRSRGLRRSSLVRSVRSLVDDLMYRLETPILEPGQRPAAALMAGTGSRPGDGRNTGGTPAVVNSGQTPIVMPSSGPPPPPARVPVAPAASHEPLPAGPPPMPPGAPPPPQSPGPPRDPSRPSGLPPTYVQRTRSAAAARAGTATVTGPNRRVPTGQHPAVAPPPPAYASPRNAPLPPRPRTGPVRPGGQGVAPARPGAGTPPAGRQRPNRPSEPTQRRWNRSGR